MRNLIGVEHLRKAFSNARRSHTARWVVAHLALSLEMVEERADGRQCTLDRSGRGCAAMQLCDVRAYFVNGHAARRFDPLAFEERAEFQQIAAVRGNGVRCESPLRRQVHKEPPDRLQRLQRPPLTNRRLSTSPM